MTEDDRYRIGDLVDESWAFFFGTVPGVLSLVLVSALACALFALLVFGRLHFDIIAVMGTSGAVLAGLLHAGTYLTFFLISLARADPLVPWSRIWDGLLLAFGSGFSCGVIATVVLAVLFRNAWRKRTYRLTPVEDAAAAPAADRTEAVPATPSTRPAVPPPSKSLSLALLFGLVTELLRHPSQVLFFGPVTSWDTEFVLHGYWDHLQRQPGQLQSLLLNIVLGSLIYWLLVFVWPKLNTNAGQSMVGTLLAAFLHAAMFLNNEMLLQQQRGFGNSMLAEEAVERFLLGGLCGLVATLLLAIVFRKLWRRGADSGAAGAPNAAAPNPPATGGSPADAANR